MTTFEQLPGELNLAIKRSDEVGVAIDFSIPLTDYTVTSQIVSLVTGGLVATPTVTVSNAADGIVNIALTETQTAALPLGTYRWRVDWISPGDVARQTLAGFVEVTR